VSGSGTTPPGTGASGAAAQGTPAATLSYLAYGVAFGVEVEGGASELVERLAAHLPPTCQAHPQAPGRLYSFRPHRAAAGGGPRYTLFADRKPLICGVGSAAVLRAFEADLQIHVAEMSPDFVFVHAGVVGWQGRAILLPGPSFSGKTSLVAALVRLGAEYYSDEYAALDGSGDVHPYNRRLSIRREDGSGVDRCSADELGGREAQFPQPVGLVVMSRYSNRGQWQPRRMSPGQAALALLGNTVPARRRPDVVIETLRQVVTRARVYISERGESSTVAAQILELATRP